MLFKMAIPLSIDKIVARNTILQYKEKNPKSEASGKVRFTNADLEITNVSNATPKKGEEIKLKFSGRFLGEVPVTAAIVFYSNEWKKGSFHIESMTHKQFEATILNPLLQPMSLAKAEKGTIETFKVVLDADTSLATGTLTLGYQNLKISLVKKKDGAYQKKGITSFLANIIVKNNNETKPGMRIAQIKNAPDRYRSYFNYIWKSMFAGLKDVLLFKP